MFFSSVLPSEASPAPTSSSDGLQQAVIHLSGWRLGLGVRVWREGAAGCPGLRLPLLSASGCQTTAVGAAAGAATRAKGMRPAACVNAPGPPGGARASPPRGGRAAPAGLAVPEAREAGVGPSARTHSLGAGAPQAGASSKRGGWGGMPACARGSPEPPERPWPESAII